jgi:hypothetical protein
MTSPPIPPFQRVYHLGLGRLLLLPGVWALFAGMFLWIGFTAPAEERSPMFQAAALITAIFAPFVAITWHSRLVLTEQGIAHHQLGYTVRSTWQNLQALSLNPGALLLKEPGTRSALLRWSSKLAGGVIASDAKALGEGRLIVLAPFMAHYRRGPLRADLQRCAPHLFQS